jgi:hypothetical protein
MRSIGGSRALTQAHGSAFYEMAKKARSAGLFCPTISRQSPEM